MKTPNSVAEPSRCKNTVARGESKEADAMTGGAPVASASTSCTRHPCGQTRHACSMEDCPLGLGRAWKPIDDRARDGHEILVRVNASSPVYAGYFGMANLTYGAGCSTLYPWVVLDNTNGVNQMRDGGPTGINEYCEFTEQTTSTNVSTTAGEAPTRIAKVCTCGLCTDPDWITCAQPRSAPLTAQCGTGEARDPIRDALTKIDTLAVCVGVVEPHLYRHMLSNISDIARAALISTPLSPVRAAPEDGMVSIPKAALDWLFGQGPDEKGWHFGECREAKKAMNMKNPRRYWWRSKFRKMCNIAAPQANPQEKGVENEHG